MVADKARPNGHRMPRHATLRYENVYLAIRAPERTVVPSFHREITTLRALRNADSFSRGGGFRIDPRFGFHPSNE